MVFYYSGTGNSAYVAHELARMTGEKQMPVFIPDVLRGEKLDIYTGEYLGFVFPIYSWGVPPVVLEFIRRLPATLVEKRYVWAVCTCGDEAGTAMRRLCKEIKRVSGREPDLCASVIMPNNYVLLPGFNVDSKDVTESKLDAAPRRIRYLADRIVSGTPNVRDVKEGSVPALRSMTYPLFVRWGVNPHRWHCSSECTGCGLCASVCPTHNISYDKNHRPVWGTECYSCCGCYHICPRRAIDYGKITKGKGQYHFPGYPFKN